MKKKGLACIICLRSSVIQTANSTIRLLRKFNGSMRCYSVNRYKPLQNRLLQKLLQTVTNSYKPFQTVTNRYKPVTPRTVTNRYKQSQTVTNHLLHKPL